MDPDVTLTWVRDAVRELLAREAAHPHALPGGGPHDDDTVTQLQGMLSAADDLAEAVTALDEWLSHGGFLPREWSAQRYS